MRVTLNQSQDRTMSPDTIFDFLEQASSNAPAVGTSAPSPRLPRYALDGRAILWNSDRSACTFDSTAAEYHSDRHAVSASTLRKLARSPAHYRASVTSPRKQTAPQRFGTAFHALVLEGARFALDYVVWPSRRSGKAWKIFEAANRGKEVLTQEEMEGVKGCAREALSTVAVRSDDGSEFTLNDLVLLGEKEKNYYWVDAETGLTCKARLDLTCQQVTFDLKTTDDARLEPFTRQATADGYDIQAAFYTRARVAYEPSLAGNTPFLFVACEVKAPHATLVHRADRDEFTAFGDKKVSKLMKLYKQCLASGRWPAYESHSGSIKLPLYARYPSAGHLNI